jgi:hypothetical protein
MIMINVQMGNEDIVDCGNMMLQANDVSHASRSKIEKELLAVPKFYHDRCAGLVKTRWKRGAAPSSSDRGKKLLRLFMDGVGL